MMTRELVAWEHKDSLVPDRLNCDSAERLEMWLWISRHPALVKALEAFRRAKEEEESARHALQLVFDILEDLWCGVGNCPNANEGRLAYEVADEEKERERQDDAILREEFKAREDLRDAILKCGVKVPSQRRVEGPEPPRLTEEKVAALAKAAERAPKNEQGGVDYNAIIAEALGMPSKNPK